jgi:hypothetical protein
MREFDRAQRLEQFPGRAEAMRLRSYGPSRRIATICTIVKTRNEPGTVKLSAAGAGQAASRQRRFAECGLIRNDHFPAKARQFTGPRGVPRKGDPDTEKSS